MPEPLRSVAFVDGQNFHKNLGEFEFATPGFDDPWCLNERDFLWEDFFAGVVERFDECAGMRHRLLRAYWYNAEAITPFRAYQRAIDRVLQEQQQQFPCLTESDVRRLAKAWHDDERERLRKYREDIYEKIQRETKFLEFKYVGQYVVDPFRVYRMQQKPDGTYTYRGTRVGERGVDVGIAVDMISKMPHYDVAILISGDADFLPLVRYLKDNLRQVYQFSVAKGIPPEIRYLSPWLKGVADVFAFFDEAELLDKYLNPGSWQPPAVRTAIKQRIADLEAQHQALSQT